MPAQEGSEAKRAPSSEVPGAGRAIQWRQEATAAAEAARGTDTALHVEALTKLQADFPENSRVVRNLAWANLRAGNTNNALAALRVYAAMGMILKTGPIYDAVSSAGLIDKVPQLARNQSISTHGSRVFTLPDSDLIAEDINFDPTSGHFLFTSPRKKKIVSCDVQGRCRDVVKSGAANPLDGMLAIHIDESHKSLWATTSGMSIQEDFRPERKGKSALLKYDLTSFRLIKRYEPNDGKEHALGDMTVASNGDAYVSDGASGDVYVVKQGTEKLEPLVPPGVFVSPQTPALNASESTLYVPDYVEGIAAIELASRKITWVKTTKPIALEGIDGLYWTKAGLLAIQNGTMPERIVRFHLSGNAMIDQFEVIEANWPGLGDPTHGVIIGESFYFIVNSGWDRVSEDEKTLGPGEPAQVWKVALKPSS
jgi:sugar lactone lactonase YvrE